jgi:hypothetical protein
MRRVVRPGGIAATYMWDTLGGGYVQQPLMEALHAMEVDISLTPGRGNSRIEELRRPFEQGGLTQLSTRTIELEVSCQNFEDYLKIGMKPLELG